MGTRIAGPYDPLYSEVVVKLRNKVDSYCARWIYFVLVSLFYVEEEWGDDPIWVRGIVDASKTDIAQRADVSRKGFQRAWQKLIDAGLIEELESRTFRLLQYKKKGYDAISPREIRESRKESNERLTRLEDLHAQELEAPEAGESGDSAENDGKTRLNEEKRPQEDAKRPQEDAKRDQDEASASLLVAFQKISLSGNTIVSGFYRLIGQQRISKQKRERALTVFRKLRKEDFSLEDIAFAVEWIVKNAKEELYEFAIIEHTIGQAIAARDKVGAQRKATEERDKAEEDEKAEREREQQERESFKEYKKQLSEDARADLREKALTEIRGTEGINEDMIGDALIESAENDLIRQAKLI